MDSILVSAGNLSFEIIVVDNDSSDETAKIVEQFYPQVNLIQNKKNLGYAKANNQGIEETRGEYILLLNPDTQVLEDALPLMYEFMEQNPEIGALGPKLLNPDKSVQASCREFPTFSTLVWEFSGLSRLFPKSSVFGRWRMGYFDFDKKREVDQPMGSCLMLRRETLDDVGILDENFGMFFNDVDLCFRIKKRGWKIYFYPEPKVIHFKGASTRKAKTKMLWLSHLAFYKFFKKHKTGLVNRLLLFIFLIPLIFSAWVRILFFHLGKLTGIARLVSRI
ncbi:MAG: glycosyltransferase family 2 protein [candidate division Zixibacteria bacterium]|nr:glycosyltransferase family 2 protein [candidate division Zixibacteria bacterium]